jgi:hypothetical protein
MSMDLFIARTMTTKASLVLKGLIDITESQVDYPIEFVIFKPFLLFIFQLLTLFLL